MHHRKPRVGIFMPAYNQGQYIYEAIDSLKKQSFQDFEVVIADDLSTDGITPQILKDIDYDKARVFFNKTNKGISRQTAKFSRLLENEYFFILCADDKIHPNYIEKCVKYLDKHPGKAAVASWIQCFGDDNKLIKVSGAQIGLPEMLIENNYLGSAMIRRSALKDVGYSETKKAFSKHYDYDRWVSMLEAGWSLGSISETLFYYRILSSSLSRSIDVEDELVFRKAFIDKHRALFKKHASYLILDGLRKLYASSNWHHELKEGRDWLANEYDRLSAENKALRRAINSSRINKLRRLLPPYTRNKGDPAK